MTSDDAKAQFEALLSRKEQNDHPDVIIACMLDFYRDERASDCQLEDDGDMLLYQWGTYDWGEGRWFDLNITRQFIPEDDEDEGMFQLSVTAKYSPTPELEALGSGSRWCGSRDGLSEFTDYVKGSEAFKSLSGQSCGKREVEYNQAG